MPRVVLPIFPGVVDAALTGVASALAAAGVDDLVLEFPGDEALVRTASGIRFVPSHLGFEGVATADVVVLAGPADADGAVLPAALTTALRARTQARSGHHLLAAADTGVRLLAEAGFLEGRRVVTARALRDAVAPHVQDVVVGRRVLRDGRVLTAAGAAAGFELGLALVEALAGPETAERAADALEVKGWVAGAATRE